MDAGEPAEQIIQVVLYDEAANQPEKINEGVRNPAEGGRQPVLEGGDTGEP